MGESVANMIFDVWYLIGAILGICIIPCGCEENCKVFSDVVHLVEPNPTALADGNCQMANHRWEGCSWVVSGQTKAYPSVGHFVIRPLRSESPHVPQS